MKKIIKQFVNNILSKKGLILIKKYELDHRDFKYNEAIDELTRVFNSEVAILPKGNLKRRQLLSNLYGTQVSEALYIIYYLGLTKNVTGDICEFGCANGASSALIANEIKGHKKKLWLFDSFSGLSRPSKKDHLINDMFNLGSMKKYEGTMSYKEEEVIKRLKETRIAKGKYKIIKGFIEDSILGSILPKKISFSFIDFDLYAPIKVALEYNHQHLTKNGIIIVDDYDFFSSGVKQAVKEFLNQYKMYYELILPKEFAGHFCILKRVK